MLEDSKLYQSKSLMWRIFENRFKFFDHFLAFEETGELVCEGLIKSYSGSYIVDTLMSRFNITNDPVRYKNKEFDGLISVGAAILGNGEQDTEISVIDLIMPNDDATKERIRKFIEACGWYVAGDQEDPSICRPGHTRITYEKKFQKEVDKESEVAVPDIIYHITQEHLLPKIHKNGLVPRHNDKKAHHPDRVYFITQELTKSELRTFATQFMVTNNAPDYVEKNLMTLLTIDISSIKDKIKFYPDPNADGAVYTYDNIPPDCIVSETPIQTWNRTWKMNK